MTNLRAPLMLALLAAAAGSASARDAVELYRRVVPLEATTGVVAVRESMAPTLDVPEECADGTMTCPVTRQFARAWRLDFEAETRRAIGEDVEVEVEGRGTVLLALAADRSDEESYDEYLREQLGRLAAAAFDQPFAGLRSSRPPFYPAIAERSKQPSWSCFEDGASANATRYSRNTEVGDDGTTRVVGTSSNGYGDDDVVKPLCSTLEASTANAAPEVIRTMSTPRMALEAVLSVEISDMLRTEAWPDELLAMPEGTWLGRRKVPGVRQSRGVSRRDQIVESRLAVDEVENSARIAPAALPVSAARDNAWHSRWTFETVERRLGPMPESHPIDSWSLTVSLLPTLPPRDLDREGEDEEQPATANAPYPVQLDEETLLTGIGESLDFSSEISPAVLADAIVRKIRGLESPGWVLVICSPDAEATWGVAMTPGRTSLLNVDAFCGTVASYVP